MFANSFQIKIPAANTSSSLSREMGWLLPGGYIIKKTYPNHTKKIPTNDLFVIPQHCSALILFQHRKTHQ
jgi:hypothetical protein